MSEPLKPPTNRWKVIVGVAFPQSTRTFRSQNKTYEFVRDQLPHGQRIVVQQWEGGRWRLYEVFEATTPDDSDGAAERRLSDN